MAPTPAFNADITLGAFQIGALISYVLFGVTTTQTYIYSGRFPGDPLKIKLLVLFVWLCELAHAICIGHTLYVTTITDYGHPERLARAPASLGAALFFSGFVGTCVQCFFTTRIYTFGKSLFLSSVCWFLSLLRLVFSITGFVFALRMNTLAEYEAQFGWLLSTILIVGAVVDLTIAASMVYYLSMHRNRIEYKRTIVVMDKLIKWTIETGVVTSAGAITTLVCFLTMKTNFIWLGCFAVMARLFSISLFASLNGRTSLRSRADDVVTLQYSNGPSNSSFTPRLEIEMTKVIEDDAGNSK
ncbi:hypothetical protein B0H11DRAFT_1149382 [Mycena galericulata]|nr:hypothetical protein B0H11DRAFT_1149382 [Mycena galericulata]